MPPTLSPFLPADLEARLRTTADGKYSKTPVELRDCELKQLTQYFCDVEYKGPSDRRGTIVCRPLTRLFRRCEGGLTVETTSWEGMLEAGRLGEQDPEVEARKIVEVDDAAKVATKNL